MEREFSSFGRHWADLSEDVLSGMRDWRVRHPQATRQAIETELDCRLASERARMLEHLAQQSQAAAWGGAKPEAVECPMVEPRCPQCGTTLEPRGRKTRRRRTPGNQERVLQRE